MTFTLRQAPHTKAGYAFYDGNGNEWQALELYNRDSKQIVMLPYTDEVNESPNISITRHNGYRTTDNGTYNHWIERYQIKAVA